MSLTLHTGKIWFMCMYFLQEVYSFPQISKGVQNLKKVKNTKHRNLRIQGHSLGKKNPLDSQVRLKDPEKIILQPLGTTQALFRRWYPPMFHRMCFSLPDLNWLTQSKGE